MARCSPISLCVSLLRMFKRNSSCVRPPVCWGVASFYRSTCVLVDCRWTTTRRGKRVWCTATRTRSSSSLRAAASRRLTASARRWPRRCRSPVHRMSCSSSRRCVWMVMGGTRGVGDKGAGVFAWLMIRMLVCFLVGHIPFEMEQGGHFLVIGGGGGGRRGLFFEHQSRSQVVAVFR